MPEFLIGALRAVIELIGWSLLGQGVLAVVSGKRRQGNVIYRLFELITRPPRLGVATLVRRPVDSPLIAVICFVILLIFWIGLAILRKFV